MTSEINLYIDGLVVQTLSSNNHLIKQAEGGMITSLIDNVKNYVSSHIDPNNKTDSLINILSPGIIAVAFGGWLGTLMGLAMRVFHIDTAAIIKSIWDRLKPSISGNKQVSSSQVDSIIQDAVSEHNQPATREEASAAQHIEKSSSKIVENANFVKLAMIEYWNNPLIKEAGFFTMFSDKKSKVSNILMRVLSWIFKISLASAGLMVAGDVVNKFLGRANAFDGTIQNGKPIEQTQSVPIFISKQTKFKVKPGYSDESKNGGDSIWMERIPNNVTSISDMLVKFAKDVYQGLDGKEDEITNSSAFKIILDRISWYNRTSPDSPMIFIPKYFTSKKQLVDYFIDDVANKVV